MISLLLWIISFISLYLAILWIHVIFLKEPEKEKNIKNLPKVTIVIPAYNEESTIAKTIKSVLKLDYPKLEVIVVNDGSTDNTAKIVKKFKKVILINQKNKGKGAALNAALKRATGTLFGCVDADTIVTKNSLKEMIHYFNQNDMGAVISTIKVNNQKNILEKIQRFEYIFSTFMRNLMSKLNTLHNTPGALSLYKTKLLKKLKGFDEDNLTEDLEIALRLHYHGYKIKIEYNSITYTNVPNTFKTLWNQRVRWFRGFIYNTVKYKKMFLNKKYGLMGKFQYPLNILTLCIIILTFGLISYEIIRRVYEFGIRVILLKWGVLNLITMPTLKELILSFNIKFAFPIIITLALALFIYYKAHKLVNERLAYPFTFLIYLFVYPVLRSMHWVTAFVKETTKFKKEW